MILIEIGFISIQNQFRSDEELIFYSSKDLENQNIFFSFPF